MPLGYIRFLPGFEHVPIFVIAGSKNINLLSLNSKDDKSNKYMQPFINAVSAVGCGQPNFFFKVEEHDILRIHFTIIRHIVSE